MTTEQRLERLERENKWMRRIGAVAVAVAAAVFLVGQGKDKELPDLEVRSLTVKDEDGRTRAMLATLSDGLPYLSLSDKDGRPRAVLTTLLNGSPVLSLCDKDGKRRALLALRSVDGSPRLHLFDAKGKVIWKAPKK